MAKKVPVTQPKTRKVEVEVAAKKPIGKPANAPKTRKLDAPVNISMKELGSNICGYFHSVRIKPGEGFNGGDLILLVLESPDRSHLISCVAADQIQKFLVSVMLEPGTWVSITKVDETETKRGYKLSMYEFEVDEAFLDSRPQAGQEGYEVPMTQFQEHFQQKRAQLAEARGQQRQITSGN